MPTQFLYPRPEYPRPDRQRGTIEGEDWLNLNGPWQFRFDGDGRGKRELWFTPDTQEWREQIIVPFCWESLAAWGEGDAAGLAAAIRGLHRDPALCARQGANARRVFDERGVGGSLEVRVCGLIHRRAD